MKVRIVTERNQQVARIDYEVEDEIADEVEQRVVAEIQKHVSRADVVVVSDYLKGCVTRKVIAATVVAAAERDVPVLVDPKIPHLDYYAGTTLVTPNHYEAEIAAHMRVRSDDEARGAARTVRDRARCSGVLMTRGDQGMWLLSDAMEGQLPASAREVSDVTGAGDTVIATLALSLAAGATMPEAARLANEAAGLAVGKFGPATVTTAELLGAVQSSLQRT
jgi:D-beta-D-heptose 7-phosphate kinase/D-beta-D-heptose 1-phosphate adenosyltransferase